MAATDIDDQVSGRKVGDEIDHFSPRFHPRLGVGLRDPVVRRADIGLGPTHTWDETIPSNKVSVRARVVPGGSPRPYAFGFPLAKEAEWRPGPPPRLLCRLAPPFLPTRRNYAPPPPSCPPS